MFVMEKLNIIYEDIYRHIYIYYIYIYIHIYIIYIKIETDVGKGKENLSIIVILSRILALDMRQKLWDISYQQAWK